MAVAVALMLLLLCSPSLAAAGRFEAIIAAAAAATRPGPAPAPQPNPGGVCDNCDGKGTIGDGTIKVTCPVCDGTGKKPPAATPTEPAALTLDDLDADSQPTPMEGVGAGLAVLKPAPNSTLVVYGSGFDARWEISAARQFPTVKVVGIEIDPELADSARRYVKHAGLDDRITIITGDATKLPIAAQFGAAYLWPETLAALKPKIQQLERFVSYSHDVPGLAMSQQGDVFVYNRRQVVMQPTTVRPSSAVWNGRHYSGRVCNRAGCTMCAAISRQLQPQTVLRPVVVDAAANKSGHWEKRCTNGVCRRVWVND